MWTCTKCGERIEDQFDSCWRCSSPRGAAEATAAPEIEADTTKAQKWVMAHRTFRGTFTTWNDLFSEAAEFATELGPERVVSISHSADSSDGVVVVWYWATEDEIASK